MKFVVFTFLSFFIVPTRLVYANPCAAYDDSCAGGESFVEESTPGENVRSRQEIDERRVALIGSLDSIFQKDETVDGKYQLVYEAVEKMRSCSYSDNPVGKLFTAVFGEFCDDIVNQAKIDELPYFLIKKNIEGDQIMDMDRQRKEALKGLLVDAYGEEVDTAMVQADELIQELIPQFQDCSYSQEDLADPFSCDNLIVSLKENTNLDYFHVRYAMGEARSKLLEMFYFAMAESPVEQIAKP